VTSAVLLLALLGLVQNDPAEVAFRILDKGDGFPGEKPHQAVVTSSKELEDQWKKLFPQKPAKPLPKIDFDQEVAAILSLGTRPHPGYGIEVTRIVRTADAVRIEYRETLPDPEKKYIQVLVHPFVIVRMARPDRKVEFVQIRK